MTRRAVWIFIAAVLVPLALCAQIFFGMSSKRRTINADTARYERLLADAGHAAQPCAANHADIPAASVAVHPIGSAASALAEIFELCESEGLAAESLLMTGTVRLNVSISEIKAQINFTGGFKNACSFINKISGLFALCKIEKVEIDIAGQAASGTVYFCVYVYGG